MNGYDQPVVERILKMQEEAGHAATQWLDTLKKMPTAEFDR